MTGHFGDKSFQAITCTGTDNTKKSNTEKQIKYSNPIYKKQTQENTKDTKTPSP